MASTSILPSVIVPVLSKKIALAVASFSMMVPFLIKKPFFEERLIPETKAMGAAKIKGQGLATTNTSAIRTGSPEIK